MVLGFAKVKPKCLVIVVNEKGEVRFCREYLKIDAREYLKIDAREICGCFGGGVDYFVAWNFPIAGDPDQGYGLGER